MSKFKRPPKPKTLDESKIDAFISGAEGKQPDKPEVPPETGEEAPQVEAPEPSPAPPAKPAYPWEGESNSHSKGLNLRLTGVQYAKLKYVYEHSTQKSLQKFIMSVLEEHLEKRIEEIKDEASSGTK